MFQSLSWRIFFRPLSEDIPFEEMVDELRDFDERFIIILRKHLSLLAWWCSAMIISFTTSTVRTFAWRKDS